MEQTMQNELPSAGKKLDPGFRKNIKLIIILSVVTLIVVVVAVVVMNKKKTDVAESKITVNTTSGGKAAETTPRYEEALKVSNATGADKALDTHNKSFVPAFPAAPATPVKPAPEVPMTVDPGAPPKATNDLATDAKMPPKPTSRNSTALDEPIRMSSSLQVQVESLIRGWSVSGSTVMLSGDMSKIGTGNQAGSGTTAATKTAAASAKPIVTAGDLASAVLEGDLDTDIPGAAIATITSGPLQGSRLMGAMSLVNERIRIQFGRISYKGASYKIGIEAIDPDSLQGGVKGDVDRKLMLRYGLPILTAFVTGYTRAKATVGTETVQTVGGITQSTPAPTTQQAQNAAIAAASTTLDSKTKEISAQPIGVRVPAGTTIGILFTGDFPSSINSNNAQPSAVVANN